MGWDPLGDIGDFFSDVGHGIEKVAKDIWESDAAKIIVPLAVGYYAGPFLGVTAGTGAVIGGGYGYSSIQQEKTYERAASLQRKQIAAQKSRQVELAGQQYLLTEKQMELQMGQRQIGILTERLLEQDRREPRILTLPASREQPGIVDRVNLWIDQALRA